MNKPRTDIALRQLIELVREETPFGLSDAEMCGGICHGCPKKLLEYLDCELEDWSLRLDNQDIPTFKDLNSLAKSSKKIHKVLERNDLL